MGVSSEAWLDPPVHVLAVSDLDGHIGRGWGLDSGYLTKSSVDPPVHVLISPTRQITCHSNQHARVGIRNSKREKRNIRRIRLPTAQPRVAKRDKIGKLARELRVRDERFRIPFSLTCYIAAKRDKLSPHGMHIAMQRRLSKTCQLDVHVMNQRQQSSGRIV